MALQAGQLVAPGCPWRMAVTRVGTPGQSADTPGTYTSLDDTRLVEACRSGSHAAFAALVERHRRAVYQVCYRFAGNHDDAADLSQEVFLRAYRGLSRFRGDASVGTWLYRIAVNASLNRVSTRPPAQVALDGAPDLPAAATDPVETLAADRRAAVVRAAVARLPERQRATVILRVYQGLSHREIAQALGTTEGAAKANLFHAIGNLRKMLAEERG